MERQQPTLSHAQQIQLLAGHAPAEILSEPQMRHLQWRKRIKGERATPDSTPTAFVDALHLDGQLTHVFPVSTLAAYWHLHCYVHPNAEKYKKAVKTKSTLEIAGCFICRNCRQKSGLLGELHLVLEHLTELLVMHELIHAGSYLTRILSREQAKTLADPFCRTLRHDLVWREEILCRTVEIGFKDILMTLRTLGLHPTPAIGAAL